MSKSNRRIIRPYNAVDIALDALAIMDRASLTHEARYAANQAVAALLDLQKIVKVAPDWEGDV